VSDPSPDPRKTVNETYSRAAESPTPDLCCPAEYEPRLLDIIPSEVVERDYGCGDPSRHVRPGETVLDLGSGGGKICFIAAQVVGPRGRVIGVDENDKMLALARTHRPEVARRLGFGNVEFRKGRIQDLSLDLDALQARLAAHPVRDVDELEELFEWRERQRIERPLIATASIDIVVSNCVLNLVRHEERRRLFAEIHRVLKPGGRAVISDIVSDRPVPDDLRADAQLWSACVSGAFSELEFVGAFADADFPRVDVLAREERPWRMVREIGFRSLTVEARKGEPLSP